ncbi:MAG: hypothetical protein E6J34_05410 [Chloroflexi bacterium]|nr:MAG: hypothetical protein E6J34_05410 [Chloroflexota bacterium]
MPLNDYYAILGVSRDATREQIKRAYRQLARLHHPDLNQQASDRRMKQLNEAYTILSNTAKRAAYDIQLLEEMRTALILEALLLQQERMQQAQHEAKMTWKEGVTGFIKELRKGMHEG